MAWRATPTQRQALRAARKIVRRAVTRRTRAFMALGALAGAAIGVTLQTVVLGLLIGLGGMLAVFGWAVWAEAQSSRVLIAKGLQRLGVRFLPGQSRYDQRSPQVGRLVDRAWEGHVTRGLDGLAAIADEPSARVTERVDARLALADWHLAQGSPNDALTHLRAATALRARRRPLEHSILLVEAASLGALDEPLLDAIPPSHRRRMRRDSDLAFFLANQLPIAQRLDHFNELLAKADVEPVSLAAPTFDGLHCDAPAGSVAGGPLVSVIVPMFDAATSIEPSLRSLLAQTWTELEIVVVDDASTDDSAAMAERLATTDSRVRLVRQPDNRGAYAARNCGLAVARGEFVTVHDADDWSHPRLIERQVRHLLAQSHLVANLSTLVRATADLVWVRRDLTHSQVIGVNTSSLMFRRSLTDQVGGWDNVRAGGDSELVDRLRARFSVEAVEQIDPVLPLTIALRGPNTLTASSTTGLASQLAALGARNLYRAAYSNWHAQHRPDLHLARTDAHSPFFAPALVRSRTSERHVDVVIMSDFSLPGGTTTSNLAEIAANESLGLTTGLVHNRNPRPRPQPINHKILNALSPLTTLISDGEQVSCDVLVIKYPPSVAEIPDRFPSLEVRGGIVLVANQTPFANYGTDPEFVYDIGACDAEVRRVFGRAPSWAPISPLVREALLHHHADQVAAVELDDEDWVEIIDVAAWQRPRVKNPVPRIGRHGRDSEWKWPATAQDVLAAYPNSPDVVVDILGGADTPRRLLRRLPKNWVVRGYDEIDPADYLAQLDVFVYFPHPDMVEGFGRTILEALAAGVPVIADSRFAVIFGNRITCCDATDIQQELGQLLSFASLQTREIDSVIDLQSRFGIEAHRRRISRLSNR